MFSAFVAVSAVPSYRDTGLTLLDLEGEQDVAGPAQVVAIA
jgi:hypothetical protein